jgi:Flp pilus assembly pilin Flp
VRSLVALLRDDSGATIVEYAVIAVALALPMIVIGAVIATTAGNQLSSTSTHMQTLGQTPP